VDLRTGGTAALVGSRRPCPASSGPGGSGTTWGS